MFYNSTKAGVDCMDQMVTHSTSERSTKRWTFAFFCNMLDIMGLAAFCICKEIDQLNKPDARRTFLEDLSKSLVTQNIENRMNSLHVMKHFSTRCAFESFFNKPINVSIWTLVLFSLCFCFYFEYSSFRWSIDSKERSRNWERPNTLQKKRICQLCLNREEKRQRKTRYFCAKCNHPVCQQHSKVE